MFKLLSFLHLYLFFYFLAFEFMNQYFRFTFGCRLLLSFRHLGFQKFEILTVYLMYGSPCQISSKSVKRLRRSITIFTMSAVRHLRFWKFNFLSVRPFKRPILHNHAKFREHLSIPCCDIAICVVFVWFCVVCRYLVLWKIRNFNGVTPVGNQFASPCQISSISVKRLQRYGDITVFILADVRHFGFWKFKFFNGQHG